jgi:hypothetical protein
MVFGLFIGSAVTGIIMWLYYRTIVNKVEDQQITIRELQEQCSRCSSIQESVDRFERGNTTSMPDMVLGDSTLTNANTIASQVNVTNKPKSTRSKKSNPQQESATQSSRSKSRNRQRAANKRKKAEAQKSLLNG